MTCRATRASVAPRQSNQEGAHTRRFVLVRANKSSVTFNIESLVSYMVSTGDFSDPISRLPFSDADLERLDAEAAQAGLHLRSVVAAKRDDNGRFSDQNFKRDALLGASEHRLVATRLALLVCERGGGQRRLRRS